MAPKPPIPILAPGVRITDTHCHLDMSQFSEDAEDVIKRAFDSGIGAMITVGSDLKNSIAAIEMAQRHKNIFASVGIHPHDARHYDDKAHEELLRLLKEPKVVAIGETGLDYHYMHSSAEEQVRAFYGHIGLAREAKKPLIVHSREAGEETLRILRESGANKGVMHCFSGDIAEAKEVIGLGFYISIAGPVTFPKSKTLKEAASFVPDDSLLIETDAPYLAPVPFRGQRNEPAHILYTAMEIASLRGVTLDDIARLTTLNAHRLFGVGEAPRPGEITYRIRDSLYLNITNRCTNQCGFCVRNYSDFVKGHNLRLEREPSADEIKTAIGEPKDYKEIVFCGYGEPLMRLDVVKEVAAWVKERGGAVRINTNGQGNLIHGRDIIPELRGIVDAVSISLVADTEEAYDRLARPTKPGAYKAVLDFIKKSSGVFPSVEASVVEQEGVSIERCKTIASELGAKLRVRKLDIVG